MGVSTASVISELIRNGIFATINQSIDYDTASLVAAEMGMELIPKGGDGGDGDAPELVAPGAAEDGVRITPWGDDDPANLVSQAPIVTIMGHVDHGKTSPWTPSGTPRSPPAVRWHHPAHRRLRGGPRRPTDRVSRHAGPRGVHRHAGPGAQVTDIAVIVVAADDGVMPQTRRRSTTSAPRASRSSSLSTRSTSPTRTPTGQAGAVRAWRPDRGVWRRHPSVAVSAKQDRDRRPARGHRPGGRPRTSRPTRTARPTARSSSPRSTRAAATWPRSWSRPGR